MSIGPSSPSAPIHAVHELADPPAVGHLAPIPNGAITTNGAPSTNGTTKPAGANGARRTSKRTTVSLVIPAKNEARNLPSVLSQVPSHASTRSSSSTGSPPT